MKPRKPQPGRHHPAHPASRLTAALLSGTLILGTLPTPALAVETDREGEGSTPPALVPGKAEEDPDFDPGGDDIALEPTENPETDQPTEEQEEEAEGLPVDPAAETEPEDASVDAAPADLPEPAAEPEPSRPNPSAPAPPTAPRSAAGEPDRPAAATAKLIPIPPNKAKQTNQPEPTPTPDNYDPKAAPGPARLPAEAVVLTDPQPSNATPTPVSIPRESKPRFPRPGMRLYRVREGDSLWSIAKALLPKQATNTEIARKVAELWQTNKDQIATDNPDLLPTGTKLKLT